MYNCAHLVETSFTPIPPTAMFSLNRIDIIGYQTQPVTVRQTPGGASVTDLNIVVPYSFRSEKGEQIQGKSFHTVTVWGSMADIAGQYVRPGSQLFISGRLQTDSWEDEQTKEKRSKTKLVCMDMILLDPKSGQADSPPGSVSVTQCLNRVQIVGNVTRDPELRVTTSGQNVVSFSVATNERWKDKASGEMKERSEFHNIVVWGELALETQKYIKKGNRAYVSGRVQTRTWETQTGQKRYTTETIADQVLLLGIKNADALASLQSDAVLSQPPHHESDSSAGQSPAAGMAMPDISYESTIKPEDLPF